MHIAELNTKSLKLLNAIIYIIYTGIWHPKRFGKTVWDPRSDHWDKLPVLLPFASILTIWVITNCYKSEVAICNRNYDKFRCFCISCIPCTYANR